MAKKKRYQDPHASREAEKYDNPVPSRELILQVLDEQSSPLSMEELLVLLSVSGEESEIAFERRLRAMIRDGQLVRNRAGRFGPVQRMNLIAGRVQGHRDGFGFLVTDEKGAEDLFLSPRQMQNVLDGDRVLVSSEGRNRFGKREARIVEIVERGTTDLVGVYQPEGGVHFLAPQNRRLAREVLITELNGLKPSPGDHIRTRIVQYPDRDKQVLVELEEIIASPDEPGMEVEVAVRNFDIPFVWPEEVEAEAEAIPEEVQEADKQGRIDLRDLPLVTIDGEDARDFDDAVYVEARKRGGWRLIVAIADVSHYVTPGSPLDEEAQVRGTSVYFPRRVIPMLPEKLSNGLCSLNPHIDRLCQFCEMQIAASGKITKFQFGEGVMRSHHRLTYTQVGALLEAPEGPLARSLAGRIDGPSKTMLHQFYDLYHALRSQRDERGAIDFETTETRIVYDESRKISAIEPVVRNVAHKMIEEAMLAANICAARLLEKSGLPALFRNHEAPKPEKLKSLQQFISPLGLSIDWSERQGEPTPAMFRKLTTAISGRPDREVIQTVMLRSLTQAKYEAENKGHFGLAYKAYTHFTSPIRRYPDLLVHRAIRYLIRSGEGGNQVVGGPGLIARMRGIAKKHALPYSPAQMVALGEHCSLTERRADDATRDVVQWLKCQYMQQHLGDEFDGVVSGVAAFGLFIQIGDLFIEGMVHVANLDSDYYKHDAVRHVLVGESSGQRYGLGDQVRVKVAAVNVEDRKIDLMVVGKLKAKRQNVREQIAAGHFPDKGAGGGKGKGKSGSAGRGKPAGGKPAGKSGAKASGKSSASPASKKPSATAEPAATAAKKPARRRSRNRGGRKPA
ncbi:MAG: ribonuclease R [Gammaproteobacteria bacterium HGW-Gammaproteobacteria-14]|nr:MAG: ribonuclease R [Gammaproteobacteria bacterium HGW-Gammaproteobacteria-14]